MIRAHYDRIANLGDRAGLNRWAPIETRLLQFIQPETNGCWAWQRDHGRRYGRIYLNGQRPSAQAVVYRWLIGPVPEGHELDHLCENKHCVNPLHLEPVTHAENVSRWFTNHRRDACRRGHRWEPGSYWSDRRGYKSCKTCYKARRARRAA